MPCFRWYLILAALLHPLAWLVKKLRLPDGIRAVVCAIILIILILAITLLGNKETDNEEGSADDFDDTRGGA